MATVKKKEPTTQEKLALLEKTLYPNRPAQKAVAKPTRTLASPTRSPMDSKGQPKTGGPIFGGPLGRAIADTNFSSLKGAATRANAARRGQPVAQAPARPTGRAATMAPLKPMSFISQPAAPKTAPAARPVAKTTARPAASTAAPAAKPMARPATAIAKIDTPMVRVVPNAEKVSLLYDLNKSPMAKREVKIDTTTKRGNLLQRLGERLKSRQLARASKSVGTPMKSTSSVPSTPTPSAPQTESGQKLSMVGRAMLDKYMSKKYMGGGKMKSYAKGGMIEKEGMKPKGKMDKKKAFMEMIAKLKAKKK
jgi:hypothetical protein